MEKGVKTLTELRKIVETAPKFNFILEGKLYSGVILPKEWVDWVRDVASGKYGSWEFYQGYMMAWK